MPARSVPARSLSPHPNRRWLASALGLSLLSGVAPGAVHSTTTSASPQVSLTEIIETASIDGVSFSPDGRWISYRTVSRLVELNRTALQWHVVATDGKQTISLGSPLEPTWVPMFDSVEEADQVWSPAAFQPVRDRGHERMPLAGPCRSPYEPRSRDARACSGQCRGNPRHICHGPAGRCAAGGAGQHGVGSSRRPGAGQRR